jgi:hypothetical protein
LILQQIEIAQHQCALRDDGHGMTAAREHGQNAARHLELFLERLVAVGIDAERDRLADVPRFGELRLENGDRIRLVEQLGLEIQAG